MSAESVPVPVTDSPRVRSHIDCGGGVTVAACLPKNTSPDVIVALAELGRAAASRLDEGKPDA